MTEQYYDFGIMADGITDDSPALQRAIDASGGYLELPAGIYRITSTLRLPSDMHLQLHPYAVMKLCGDVQRKEGDFLITNADPFNGNANIRIEGGLWDGNCCGKYNEKPDIFTPGGWSGCMFSFKNVKNLTIANMTVMDSPAYFFRLCETDGFTIQNIIFSGIHARPNQDGLHLCGNCRNGTISGLVALDGQTNDDFIALNADDCTDRVENYGMTRGPIENIRIENIVAEDCHTFLRLLSVDSPIRNISVSNVRCGCRQYAVNMDAARYCRTPLFEEQQRPEGVGHLENITISSMTAYASDADTERPLICCETNCKNVRIERFTRDFIADRTSIPVLGVRNVTQMRVALRDPTDIGGTAKRTATGLYFETKQETLQILRSFASCYFN